MKTQNRLLTRAFIVCFCLFCSILYADDEPLSELETLYFQVCDRPSDINEHIPVLRKLSSECSNAVEIGIRGMVSTWGVLLGLSENESPNKSYLGIDLDLPPWGAIAKAQELAELNGIAFDFWQENDMNIQIPPTEFLFIDSLHTYCHLTYELEKFSPNVSKYIAMHDTSAPWGNKNDSAYNGDYSEYPEWYNKNKQGLWPAVQDFLESHPEWVLQDRLLNNHGFTILKRIEIDLDDLQNNATIPDKYEQYCNNNECSANVHLPLISRLASECSTVTEIGVKSMGLTWGTLNGLVNAQASTSYLGIGKKAPRSTKELDLAKNLANKNGIDFTFWKANDLFIQIEPTDMLLIDTLYTYCHLTYELKTFAKNVAKYICVFFSFETKYNIDDPLYLGDYSEYPAAYDKTKKGVWPALEDFLKTHPEWTLLETIHQDHGLAILTRCDDNTTIKRMDDPEVQLYLEGKIILCTGPSLNRYEMLKESTESDLSLIKFKKIFISTNDPSILDISFNKRKPDGCILLDNWGKQLDCLNCILTTMKAAVNDPEVLDDDILMFKHESVFINDMGLIKRIIRKMLNGSDLITRTGMFGTCTDHFFVKVSAVKDIIRDYPLVDSLSHCCETSFKEIIVNRIANIYNLRFNHSLWRFTQLGAYHYYPGQGAYNSEADGWNMPWWDKKNYENLFK